MELNGHPHPDLELRSNAEPDPYANRYSHADTVIILNSVPIPDAHPKFDADGDPFSESNAVDVKDPDSEPDPNDFAIRYIDATERNAVPFQHA